jgi:hypothetical protein
LGRNRQYLNTNRYRFLFRKIPFLTLIFLITFLVVSVGKINFSRFSTSTTFPGFYRPKITPKFSLGASRLAHSETRARYQGGFGPRGAPEKPFFLDKRMKSFLNYSLIQFFSNVAGGLVFGKPSTVREADERHHQAWVARAMESNSDLVFGRGKATNVDRSAPSGRGKTTSP